MAAGPDHSGAGGRPRSVKAAPMRFSPLVPPRRPLFGRRQPPPAAILPAPTSEERRLIDRKIGRAHVSTPVTNAHPVCRLLLQKKKEKKQIKEIEEKVVTKYIKINLSTKNT